MLDDVSETFRKSVTGQRDPAFGQSVGVLHELLGKDRDIFGSELMGFQSRPDRETQMAFLIDDLVSDLKAFFRKLPGVTMLNGESRGSCESRSASWTIFS